MTATVGWSVPLEQLGPVQALAGAELAEAHGSSGVMAADHFAPTCPHRPMKSVPEVPCPSSAPW